MSARAMLNVDWTTINMKVLASLPPAKIGGGCRIDRDMGCGCAGDPPGYPTYFLRNVWNSHGNTPHTGSSMVIVGPVGVGGREVEGQESTLEERDALMKRLYVPLPVTHPRTQAWIRETFAHHRHCYQVPELRAAGKNWSDAMLIWPGGCCGNTPFGRLLNSEHEIEHAKANLCYDKWTEEAKRDFCQNIVSNNSRVIEMCQKVAVPENHDATILVRKVYPDFQPTAELIEAKFDRPGNWWEVLAENPGPDNCPGQYGHSHPVNGNWCQFCGWKA